DAERFAAALKGAELVIVQDAYHPTETGALAHVVLPAAQWPEKDGTMTNSERRVSLVQRALDPPGQALPDWEIFARVARALGHGEAHLVVRVSDALPPGTAFAPFHWGALHLPPGAGAVNAVTSPALDPVSRQAELKACAVRVERATRAQPRCPDRAPQRLLVV